MSVIDHFDEINLEEGGVWMHPLMGWYWLTASCMAYSAYKIPTIGFGLNHLLAVGFFIGSCLGHTADYLAWLGIWTITWSDIFETYGIHKVFDVVVITTISCFTIQLIRYDDSWKNKIFCIICVVFILLSVKLQDIYQTRQFEILWHVPHMVIHGSGALLSWHTTCLIDKGLIRKQSKTTKKNV